MAFSPYDVLAPYNALDRTQRFDRWTQLHTDPPAQRAQPLETAPPSGEPEATQATEAAETTETTETTQALSLPQSAPSPAPAVTAHTHRFYDQIIRKHTAAAKSVAMNAMRRP